MKVNLKSPGVIAALVTAVLALVSMVVYFVNVGGSGYFHSAYVSNLVLFCILAALAMVCAVILTGVKTTGIADTAITLVVGALQIITPVLLALCLINLAAARAEGLGFIYFSNADVILEVQTPENLASATGTIVNMVCLAVSMVAGIVSSFLTIKKAA